jgi:hypothetical protein
MTRLDLDPNNFAAQFKGLRTDLEQIKNAQRSGKDIWKPHIIEALDGSGNPTAYDLIANVPDGFGGLQQRQFIATMTADNQDQVFAIPIYRVFRGSPTTPPAHTSDVAGFSYLEFSVNQAKKIAYSGRFGDNVYPFSVVTYLKVYFYATDTGTLQVVGNP